MKKVTYLGLTIVTLIFIVVFTLQNKSNINVTLFLWDFEVSLALLIFSLFSFGIIIAIFVLIPVIISLKSTLKKDEKIISEFQHTQNIISEKTAEK